MTCNAMCNAVTHTVTSRVTSRMTNAMCTTVQIQNQIQNQMICSCSRFVSKSNSKKPSPRRPAALGIGAMQ